MGGGTQGCGEPPGDLPGGGGTTCMGLAPGSPLEAQWGPARAKSCQLCFCSLLALGELLGWVLARTDPIAHILPGLGHLLSKRHGAREQPPLQLQLGSAMVQSILAGVFPITELGQWEEAWFYINNLPSLGKGRLWADLRAAHRYLDGVTGKGS